ncbi:MAG: protein kinase [Thermoanaerobaculaceae bacterium]|nr:protein kinase [Thermoanaerobaculaceae bacterium]
MIEFRTGVEVGQRYVIHSHVGTGGFASVWRASDKQLNRDVAIKRLLRKGFGSPDGEADAIREAQKSARLVHPNIVQVYDIVHLSSPPEPPESLIVMEFVDGRSLHQILREKAMRSEVFPLDQGISLLRDILAGVAYAHSSNICHRDLTPLNILLSSAGSPKIADFGIARVLQESNSPGVAQTSTHGGTGNPIFMSPEQARGEQADFLSDLFMVGIVGYLLITGRHPFAHSSGLFEIPELIQNPEYLPDVPRPPSSLTAVQQRNYREYAAVVVRMLQRERASRFGSARDAILALEAVQPFVECPQCGERLRERDRFCSSCGLRLDSRPEEGENGGSETGGESPEDPNTLVERGFQLTREQHWEQAVGIYRRAIEQAPGLQRAYWYLGFALNHLGRFEEAVDALNCGVGLPTSNPEHTSQFLYALAFAYMNLKRYPEALQHVEKALVLQPRSSRTIFLRARINTELGRNPEALRDANEVLRLNPEHAGAIRLVQVLGGSPDLRS